MTTTSGGTIIGFGRGTQVALPKMIVKDVKDFVPLHEVELNGIGKVFVGPDRKLYRKTNSLMRVIAPCECDPEEKNNTRVFFDDVKWEDFPPLNQLKYLYENFLSRYNREVMFAIGKRHDGNGWLYAIPKQEGTVGSIKWWKGNMEDREAQEGFADQAEFVGTVHIHPGESATPSTVDTDHWAKPAQTGLHMIFGRKGAYTIHGSAAGQVLFLLDGKLEEGLVPVEVPLELFGRPLETLLLQPPPPKRVNTTYYGGKRGRKNRHWRGGGKHMRRDATHQSFDWEKWEEDRHNRDMNSAHDLDYMDTEAWNREMARLDREERDNQIRSAGRLVISDDPDDEIGLTLDAVSALKMYPEELGQLRIVRHNGQVYMMTAAQYSDACAIAKDWNVVIPPATVVQRAVKNAGVAGLLPGGTK